MHQAAGIVRDHVVGSRLFNGGQLVFSQFGGDLGELDREGSAKTAATLRSVHFHQVESFDGPKQLSRLPCHSQLAEQVTRVMVGRFAGKSCPCFPHLENRVEEVGEFSSASRQRLRRFTFGRLFEKLRQVFDHGGTGAGRDNHPFAFTEDLEQCESHLSGFRSITAVEGGLATTDLSRIKGNFNTQFAQQPNR